MKRILLLFVASILTFSFMPVSAQVKLGVQGGINLAEYSLDPEQTGFEMGMRTGVMFGGIINYNFSPLLGLQAEPAYIQRGSSTDITEIQDGQNIKGEGTLSANYIDIPVLLKATFETGQVKPFLLAGASIALLLGDAKFTIDKVTVNGQDVTNMLTAGQKEQTQKTKSRDFVLNFGGGLMIPVGQADIFIEGLYNLGLTDISDEPYDDTKVKNKGIQIKAGVLFLL